MKSKFPSCSSTNRLTGDTCRQALPAPRPLGGCRVPPGAQRLKNPPRCRYHLAVLPSPPGTHITVTLCWIDIAWRHRPNRWALRYQALSDFLSITWRNRSLPSGAISIQQSLLVYVLYIRFFSILISFWYQM